MKNLAKAILNVMRSVNGVSKDMTVGAGSSSYKAVSYMQVSQKIREAMINEGLIMVPISIEQNTTVERWEAIEWDNFKKSEVTKMKQQVMTEAHVTYELIHVESGESMTVEGYGIGVDSQDKSAGKATTYALKYALLYTFLVPTGLEDVDGDKTHSNSYETPKTTTKKVEQKKPAPKKEVKDWNGLLAWVKEDADARVPQAISIYNLTDEQLKILADTK